MNKFCLHIALYLSIIGLLSCSSTYDFAPADATDAAYSGEPRVEEVVVSGVRASGIGSEDDEDSFDSEAKAKEKTWRAAGEQANTAVVSVGDDEAIEPEAIDVKVQIDGFRARVVIEGLYINPHDQTLEGDFKFRLPDGAKPYYFAFGEAQKLNEVSLTGELTVSEETVSAGYLSTKALSEKHKALWKEPKEAVMVSRKKAAFAYEDTVSRQIDPALLEWAGAGIFTANVFPLMPKSVNRIVIGYDIDLQRFDDELYLDLPLGSTSIEKRVHLSFGHIHPDAVSIQRIVDTELKSLVVPAVQNGVLQGTFTGKMLNGLRVKVGADQIPALVGMDEVEEYVAIQWLAELPQIPANNNPKAVFVLDTSLSASPEKFHLWVELLLETLVKNEKNIETFSLLSFNTSAHWWKPEFVANTQANRKTLESYLYSLILEGATDLSRALESAVDIDWLETQASYDLFLYSDGSVTWGDQNPWSLSEKLKNSLNGKLFAYRLGMEGEDKELLDHLVREIGGASFHLPDKSKISSLATAHNALPWSIDSVELVGAEDVLLAGRPGVIYPGQSITIAARKIGELGSEVRFALSAPNKTLDVEVPLKRLLPSTLTARVYGQVAVAQLEGLGDLERKVAAAYANHFKVPGSSSSLLMLESDEDYKRYNIEPEQDAYVVKSTQVTDLFSALAENIATLLSDPKKAFIEQLKELSELKSVSMSLPHSVNLLIERLPQESFNKPSSDVNAKVVLQRQVSDSYLEGMREEKIYALVVSESERRFKSFGSGDAIKVMSNLVERAPSDVSILRDVAYAAEYWGHPDVAYELHQRALDYRPFEPQSYHFLANLSEKIGMYDLALLYFEMGLSGSWGNRFKDFETIHKMDYLSFIERTLESEVDFHSADYAKIKQKQLKAEFPESLDLLIVTSWNTDRTDVDLHVVEPSGEECFYEHKVTRSKGIMSNDVTQGYGPEFYQNERAPNGKYQIFAKYFSDNPNKLGLKTKVNVRVIENWGTREQTEVSRNIVLNKPDQKQKVLKFRISN
ncbi:VWA domain-containing protein [Teredinibacter franksiae]|uniref:VWA domain-containing protein n=1 Tax=Teredinibacter franksiae TaxID=2761453 RepID=UPI0016275DF9|nr:VWA domain-containing protein [Teredinibacter franksiae]